MPRQSVTLIELKARSFCNFFGSPLETKLMARSGNNSGLPAEGVVLANNVLQTARTDENDFNVYSERRWLTTPMPSNRSAAFR
jgi:hypothetical protein